MALEPEIARLVDEFIAAGRPSPRMQHLKSVAQVMSPARYSPVFLRPA